MYPAALVLFIVSLSCGSNGHITEDEFFPRNDAERQAKVRIQHWVDAAAKLLEDNKLPAQTRAQLQGAIRATRSALSRYNNLRDRGATRAVIIAPIQASAGAIVANDATGVGVGDDILLIPLALAAIATFVLTDAAATANELGEAWNDVMDQLGKLAIAAASATVAAAATIDSDVERRCMEQMVRCLENPWQPDWNRAVFGPRKNCPDCYFACTASGGTWPYEKCPR